MSVLLPESKYQLQKIPLRLVKACMRESERLFNFAKSCMRSTNSSGALAGCLLSQGKLKTKVMHAGDEHRGGHSPAGSGWPQQHCSQSTL